MLLIILTVGTASASQDLNDTVSSDSQDLISQDDVNLISNDGDGDDDDNESDEGYDEVFIDIPELVEIGSEDVVEIQLPDDAKGRIDLRIDGVLHNTTQVDGEEDNLVTLSLDFLSCEQHLVNVTFISSTSKYGTVSNQTTVNVTYNITINIVEDPYIFGKETNMVYVSAPKDILLKVNVTIDNRKYQLIKLSETVAYIDISSFEGGSYLITASYEGDDLYSKYSTNETINVVSAIDAPEEALEYGSEAYVVLKLPGNANGNLTLYLNGEFVNKSSYSNGEARIKFPTSKVGIFNFTVLYDGDDIEIEPIIERFIEIYPKVNVPSQMTVGENKYITFSINSDAKGTFLVEADWEQLASVSPTQKVSLANLDDGEIDIGVTYFGENEYVHYYDAYNLIVNSLPVRFEGVKPINMLYYDGTSYSIKIYGSNGKALEEDEYVEFIIGNHYYEGYTNSKGIVNFRIPYSVTPGKYTVRIGYDESIIPTTLVVKPIFTLKKVNVKKSAKKLVLKATFKKANNKFLNGKPVVFKFNGKKYTAKISKGVAKVTIKQAVLKKLKVGKKITYQASYFKSTVKQSVKVKK